MHISFFILVIELFIYIYTCIHKSTHTYKCLPMHCVVYLKYKKYKRNRVVTKLSRKSMKYEQQNGKIHSFSVVKSKLWADVITNVIPKNPKSLILGVCLPQSRGSNISPMLSFSLTTISLHQTTFLCEITFNFTQHIQSVIFWVSMMRM